MQSFVNAAFRAVMTGDAVRCRPTTSHLRRIDPRSQISRRIVALPVPEPYARRYVSGRSIEQSLPDAVGALRRLDRQSERVEGDRAQRQRRRSRSPRSTSACCSGGSSAGKTDVTRAYVEALEARGIPHVLVGGRAFHEREEVEAIRAALTAIEWPDDELSVFATLRGPFFAIGDEELLEWAHRFGRQDRLKLRARRSSIRFACQRCSMRRRLTRSRTCEPIARALRLLRRLHVQRNYVQRDDRAEGGPTGGRLSGGVSGTLQELLAATRAHVGFALRTGGEQALANVLHITELARQYEMGGGISFRGFVEELRVAADTAQASEAPILEEDSDGVRMMTVHKAKGLEFPIVILADMTCRISRPDAGRWIDPTAPSVRCSLGGWTPADLLLHGYEEAARDKAEGDRLAYVAATRARDVLVVPTIGDEVFEGGWLDPLMPATYPSPFARATVTAGPGCPAFPSRDSVLTRPDGDPARPMTVPPGMYKFSLPAGDESEVVSRESPSSEPRASAFANLSAVASAKAEATADKPSPGSYSVVWWDPHVLALDADSGYGLRRDDLIVKDGKPADVAARLAEYRAWQDASHAARSAGRTPSLRIRTATTAAADRAFDHPGAPEIDVVAITRSTERPFGPRFGALVHATLATVPLDASESTIAAVAAAQGRILLVTRHAAIRRRGSLRRGEVVTAVLRDRLFDRVRIAERSGQLRARAAHHVDSRPTAPSSKARSTWRSRMPAH